MANLKKQLEAVKELLGNQRDLKHSDEDALRYQDVLLLLEDRGYVKSLKSVAQYWYYSFNPDESPYTAEEKKWLDSSSSSLLPSMTSSSSRISCS